MPGMRIFRYKNGKKYYFPTKDIVKGKEMCVNFPHALSENLTGDAIAQLYVTKFSTIFLCLTKLFVTYSFALASSVTNREICQNCSNSVADYTIQYCIWTSRRLICCCY